MSVSVIKKRKAGAGQPRYLVVDWKIILHSQSPSTRQLPVRWRSQSLRRGFPSLRRPLPTDSGPASRVSFSAASNNGASTKPPVTAMQLKSMPTLNCSENLNGKARKNGMKVKSIENSVANFSLRFVFYHISISQSVIKDQPMIIWNLFLHIGYILVLVRMLRCIHDSLFLWIQTWKCI